MPSLLSTRAILAFGRHETHIRYLPPSLSKQTSKQVPYWPPSTGLPAYFFHPPGISGESAVSRDGSAAAARPATPVNNNKKKVRAVIFYRAKSARGLST